MTVLLYTPSVLDHLWLDHVYDGSDRGLLLSLTSQVLTGPEDETVPRPSLHSLLDLGSRVRPQPAHGPRKVRLKNRPWAQARCSYPCSRSGRYSSRVSPAIFSVGRRCQSSQSLHRCVFRFRKSGYNWSRAFCPLVR